MSEPEPTKWKQSDGAGHRWVYLAGAAGTSISVASSNGETWSVSKMSDAGLVSGGVFQSREAAMDHVEAEERD